MNRTPSNWITLILRFTLGILYLACSLATMRIHFYLAKDEAIKSWLPTQHGDGISLALSILLLIISIGLMVGIKLREVAIASAATLLVILLLFLVSDPFHDTMKHLVPLFIISIVIYALSAKSLDEDDSTSDSIIALFLRLFIGFIFISQGGKLIFVTGPFAFAERVYVNAFSSVLPSPLLWMAGIVNPIILFLSGLALVAGYQTKLATLIASGFLVSIVFGHMLQDPYETTGDLTHYGLNNLGFVLGVWYYSSRSNKYSLDYFFRKKSNP